MQKLRIDTDYLTDTLLKLLEIPSPAGYTDHIVHFVGEELQRLRIEFELTRRGAIRATLPGQANTMDRALVAHLDTLGAMVSHLREDGRLAIRPIGTWPARFAEGGRVTIISDHGFSRGTVLPMKASGHIYDEQVDAQPSGWDHLQLRVDQPCSSARDLHDLGYRVGDYVAFDSNPEMTDTGFIVSRHLDDKAGVACLLAAAKAVTEADTPLHVEAHLLFTLFEEIGSGASAVLHGDVAEMVAVDNGTAGPQQNSTEHGVTLAMMDSSGPFDYHLTHKLIGLCDDHGIDNRRDVFKYYRCDAASAVEAGNDIRTALVCFGVDASHGYERTHLDSLRSVAELVALYLQSEPAVPRDRLQLGPLSGFPDQPV